MAGKNPRGLNQGEGVAVGVKMSPRQGRGVLAVGHLGQIISF